MSQIESTYASGEARISDFIALLKPKVMSLVVFTGLAGMWVAPDASHMHPLLSIMALFSIALGAGAAGAINMWYERDIDAVMKRTQGRPIPRGRIDPEEALSFGIFTSIIAVVMMSLATNWVAASLLAAANLYYVFIYTVWLKRRTPQNIVIGGAAGAFPPMIGWAAVTGDVSLYPLIMFAIIFMWTPPHFWALSLFANEDYKRAKIPMMTVTAGATKTKWQMLAYTLLLLPLSLTPYFLGFASGAYAAAAALLGSFFIYTALRVLKSEDLKHARAMFGYSVFYLFALFLALMVL